MKKKPEEKKNNQADKVGSEFTPGKKVVFRKGLARATFGKGPYVIESGVYEDDLGEPCIRIIDEKGMVSAFPVDYFDIVIEERTDEHILKGLECCANYADCDSCPYDPLDEDCGLLVLKDSLEYVNRLKKENQELKDDVEMLDSENKVLYNVAHLMAEDLNCDTCFLKPTCLQVKEYGKKDVNKPEDIACCWAMFMIAVKDKLERENKIKPYLIERAASFRKKESAQ